MSKVNSRLAGLPAMLLALLPVATASAGGTVAVAPADLEGIETLDEIIIEGRLDSLSSAWQAVIEAEDRFYARYNELNKDPSMDIVCRVEAPTGTRITRRNCWPRKVDEASEQEAKRFTGALEGNVMVLRADKMTADLKQHTLKLLKQDPALLRALLERARLEQHYLALRAGKLAQRKVVLD